jgi:hypothetical protein
MKDGTWSIGEICSAARKVAGAEPGEILTSSRSREATHCRELTAVSLRILRGMSWPEIGRVIHSAHTVPYGAWKRFRLRTSDEQFRILAAIVHRMATDAAEKIEKREREGLTVRVG